MESLPTIGLSPDATYLPDAGGRFPARRVRFDSTGNDLPFQRRSGRPGGGGTAIGVPADESWMIYRAITRAREALVLIEKFQ